MQKLIITANNNECSIFECLENPLLHAQIGVNTGTLNKLQNFTTLINSFKAQLERDTYELAESIAKTSGLLGELHKDKTPEGVSRYAVSYTHLTLPTKA